MSLVLINGIACRNKELVHPSQCWNLSDLVCNITWGLPWSCGHGFFNINISTQTWSQVLQLTVVGTGTKPVFFRRHSRYCTPLFISSILKSDPSPVYGILLSDTFRDFFTNCNICGGKHALVTLSFASNWQYWMVSGTPQRCKVSHTCIHQLGHPRAQVSSIQVMNCICHKMVCGTQVL